MRNLIQAITAGLVSLLLALPAVADDAATLRKMLDGFLVGASIDSYAEHNRFWAEDLIYTSSAGKRFGKATIIDGLEKNPKVAPIATSRYSAEDVDIRVYGDSAVVAFRLVGETLGDKPEVSYYLNTGTFLKRDGRWQAVAWQATKKAD